MEPKLTIIILAAGNGKRMNSALPKVMHKIANKPMVEHIVGVAKTLSPSKVIVVIGPEMDIIKEHLIAKFPEDNIDFAVQTERLGTAHAVKMAFDQAGKLDGTVLVLYGDTPLIKADTIRELLIKIQKDDLSILGFKAANPYGYGRFIINGDKLVGIVEEKDASQEQKAIDLCNSGIMCFKAELFYSSINQINNNNKQQEYYLTDLVGLANNNGFSVSYMVTEESETKGVNSKIELSQAEELLQNRLRQNAMENGVTLIDPKSIFLSVDTKFGRDVIIYPNVFIGPNVNIGDNTEIRSFSYIEGANIGTNNSIGPFARLREGTVLGDKVRIGNFVETKKAIIKDRSKINHLSYIGDAEIGTASNVGAGVITCNYDGVNKYKTVIGDESFIGSNSSIVAPCHIGDHVIIGAGSVITKDIPTNNLAIGRARQENKEGKGVKKF